MCKKDGIYSASARIRYYTFLNNIGCEWHDFKGKIDGDIAYIQKISDKDSKGFAKKAYKAGIPVIYDIDDIRENWNSKGYDSIIKYATAITTDTKEKQAIIGKYTGKPCYVVPDCIDYGITERVVDKINIIVDTVVTFGNKVTVQNTVEYMEKIPCNKYHICNEKIEGAGTFQRWEPKTFIDKLAKFDLAILANRKHWTASLKSNNRLLVCMAIGLPVIAMDIPAYSEILNMPEFYSGRLLFRHDPTFALKHMNYEVRKDLSKRMPKYAFENYSPKKSAQKLYEVFKHYGD